MKSVRLLTALMLLAVIIWGCKKEDENRPPSKPKLLEPAQGAVVAPEKITFKWEKSTDPEGEYVRSSIYLSDDSLVWTKINHASPEGTTIVNVPNGNYYFPFEVGRKYYWKVVATSVTDQRSITGTSESDVSSFYTIPLGVANLSKTSGDGFVNLTWTDPAGLSRVEVTFTPAVNGITQPITVNPGIGKLELQGMANSTVYSFYLTAFNSIGIASQADTIKAMPLALTLVHDYDFNIYSTVQIGTQTWLRENLRAIHWQNGTEMQSYNGIKYYKIGSKSNIYGYYYSYNAAIRGDQGMNPCPCGYHVPSDEDVKTLERYLGMSEADINSTVYGVFRGVQENVGKILKSTSGWTDYNGNSGNGTDIYGFNMLPAGRIFGDAELYIGVRTALWTTTGLGARFIYYFSNESNGIGKAYGIDEFFSIRCVKD